MLNGLTNFLQFVNDNWTAIIIIISLCLALYQKIKGFVSKTNEQKIEIAKQQVKEIILKLISDAEYDYEEYTKAGSIKRAQVIQQIFENYPILSKVANQTELVKWIDSIIDDALNTLREIIEMNKGIILNSGIDNAAKYSNINLDR